MLPGLGDTSGDEFSPSNSLKVFERATMFRQSMILLGLIYHKKKCLRTIHENRITADELRIEEIRFRDLFSSLLASI